MTTPTSVPSRALTIYSLPQELLDNLTVRSIQAQIANPSSPEASSSAPKPPVVPPSATSGTLKCQTCPNANFETVEEQRSHFKSDWHRYNAEAKLTGRAVGQEEWEGMVEGVSSISGSASSSSSGNDSDSDSPPSQATGTATTGTDKVAKLLKRSHLSKSTKLNINGEIQIDSEEEAELEDRRRRAQLRTAIIWFTPTSPLPGMGIPKDTQFGVHRALFPSGFTTANKYLSELRKIQLKDHIAVKGYVNEDGEEEERRLTLLMVAGGHFAGMVIGIRPRSGKEKQEVKGAGDVRVIKHKTFHRYTTRKKQGGSQGLNDNSKSKAISAGAMLRRYGEQALQEEIRALMEEWSEDLAISEKIFLRASTHGKKSFWGYEGAVLDKHDPRIRGFPFPTRRPTQQELLRCWHELTRVKISHLSEGALQAMDDAYIASLQPKKQITKPISTQTSTPSPAAPPKDPEEEARQDRHRRLVEMIRKGRLEALKPFWEKYGVEFQDVGVLGIASKEDQEDIIRWMLLDLKTDPTISLEGGKRAYDLAGSKSTRNVFRRIRYDYPEMWDWDSAHVPTGLSEEAEAAQDQKKQERRKGLREKMKEREKARAEVEPEQPAEAPALVTVQNNVSNGGRSGAQKLGGAAPGTDGGLAGMSSEMRMRIERERRARAAEARFKNLG